MISPTDPNRAVLGSLIATFERGMRRGDWAQLDTLLDSLVVESFAPSVLIGVLTISWHGKSDLKARTAFLARCEAYLPLVLGAERTAALLKNRR